jgi:hypothetical protein
MPVKKTLQHRERELQALLATPVGRDELQRLAARYYAAGGREKPEGASVVTYLLVHERVHGLIAS